MKNILVILSLFWLGLSAQQDLQVNYLPLESKGKLPNVFSQNIREIIQQEAIQHSKSKKKTNKIESNYISESNYQIDRIIRSGNVLINDEITQYINKVADIVLKDNLSLRNQISFYTLKSPVVNAYSFDKGYIFIDIGLLAQLENEAQIAYVICHEIIHYLKKHNVNSYIKQAQLNEKNYNGMSYDDKLVEKCQYSKELESEADLEGFRIYEKTNYDLRQAETVFDVLQYSHLPFEFIEFKKSFFETKDYLIPDSYSLKEVSKIRDNSNDDDERQTHPNTAKRKLAIAEIIKNRDNSNKIIYFNSKEQFEYVRDLARFEMCRLYLKNRDYHSSLYASYILLHKYPNNEYLTETITKSLFALTLYKNGYVFYDKTSVLSDGPLSYMAIEGYPQQLYYLYDKMPPNEWAIMALNYSYRSHKKFPGNLQIKHCSDSLIRLMRHIDWGISDFNRVKNLNAQIEINKADSSNKLASKTELIAAAQKKIRDTVEEKLYYKNAFIDLFISDREFSDLFPLRNVPMEIKKDKKDKIENGKMTGSNTAERILLLEPFYYYYEKDRFHNAISDTKQENLIAIVNKCAKSLKMELITIDPGIMTDSDVDKLNDYSIINDWLAEMLDAGKKSNIVLNTNKTDLLIKKYNTKYLFKTGVINVKKGALRNVTYFYSILFDLASSEIVYFSYESLKKQDTRDLITSKTYETLFILRNEKNH